MYIGLSVLVQMEMASIKNWSRVKSIGQLVRVWVGVAGCVMLSNLFLGGFSF